MPRTAPAAMKRIGCRFLVGFDLRQDKQHRQNRKVQPRKHPRGLRQQHHRQNRIRRRGNQPGHHRPQRGEGGVDQFAFAVALQHARDNQNHNDRRQHQRQRRQHRAGNARHGVADIGRHVHPQRPRRRFRDRDHVHQHLLGKPLGMANAHLRQKRQRRQPAADRKQAGEEKLDAQRDKRHALPPSFLPRTK